VHYPIPDFSKIKPKTNSWNTPKTRCQKKEVSEEQDLRKEQNGTNNTHFERKKPSRIPVLITSKVLKEQYIRQEQTATNYKVRGGSFP
jgi:hypothetical protein